MKIENRGNIPLANIDSVNSERIEKKANVSEAQSTEAKDQVNTKLSQTLESTIQAIAQNGASPGSIHSEVDGSKVSGLLHSMTVDAKRPRLSNEDVLQMADKVSDFLKANPQSGPDLFRNLDGARVAELIS